MIENKTDNQFESKFQSIEQVLGLTRKLYEAKFVYSQQQNPGPEAYLLPNQEPLKSQLAGFSTRDIRVIHALAAQMIYEAGKALKVPISTTILAQSLFHYFYARKTFIEYDIRDAAIGAMYLACKSQETLRKGYQIVLIFDYIFKLYEGESTIRLMEIEGPEYNYMKQKKVVQAEIDILFDLGFQVYQLMDLPHRHLGSLLTIFDRHPNSKKIARSAWNILNDCYFTTICLYYPSQVITAAAVFIAMRQTKSSFSTVPWWVLMETRMEDIERIEIELQNLKQIRDDTNIKYVSQRITQVAEQKHGLVNVFPVTYYRKIWLDRNGKLKITKEEQEALKKLVRNQNQNQNQQQQNKKVSQNHSIKRVVEIKPSQSDSSESEMKKKYKKKSKSKSKKEDRDKHKKRKDKKKKHKKSKYSDRTPKKSEIDSSENNSNIVARQKSAYKTLEKDNEQKIQEQVDLSRDKSEQKCNQQSNKASIKKNTNGLALNLNLSKTNLLSTINKQLVKHKQRVQQREQKIAQQVSAVFQKNQQNDKKIQNQAEQDSDDQELRIIQQLKRKVKLNRQQKMEFDKK